MPTKLWFSEAPLISFALAQLNTMEGDKYGYEVYPTA
jgi:hypothetical protein